MAAFNKSNVYPTDLANGSHNWGSHVYKAMLTNTTPDATWQVKGSITGEVAATGGYPAGGYTLTVTMSSPSAGVRQASITDLTITASGGSIGPFTYIWIYNDTQTSPNKPVVGWYTYSGPLTLASGESFTVDFDGTNGFFQLS